MTQTHWKTAAAFMVWAALHLQGSAPGGAARAQAPAAAPTMAPNTPGPSNGPETLGDPAGPPRQDAVALPPPPANVDGERRGPTPFGSYLGRLDLSRADLDMRAGYWGRFLEGSPLLAAQYQGVDSSPFANVDGLFSDGLRTVDFFATEMDNDTDAARLNLYGPRLTVRTRFDRFIHRQENDPLTNFDITRSFFRGQNFNAGEDFATRIEQASADFRGKLTENLQWQVTANTIHKHGERQVRGLHRHVTCTECHVNGARQAIDWTTVAVEPALEGKFGPIKFRLSHRSQSLTQDDQLITDLDDGTPLFSKFLPWGYVSDNYSQINRLRVYADLMEDTRFGANLFIGDAHNLFRDIHRRFNGIDLQITNHALDDRLSLTAFGKRFNDASDTTQQFVIPEEAALIQPLVNYGRTSAGVLARWRLFRRPESRMGLSVDGGYEFREIDRVNAVYFGGQSGVFEQRQTTSHLVHVGTVLDWTRSLDSYVRYKMEATQDPIYGVTTLNGTINTGLPEHVNAVEVGGNWMPKENLCVNLSIDFVPAQNHSAVADFHETNLPMALTISYAPVPRWSLSGGYMWDPIWIRQRITVGDDAPPESNIWDYSGVSQRAHLGTRFALTDSFCLTAQAQYILGQNTTTTPPPWQDAMVLSNATIRNVEISAGADWWLREHVLLYLHYNLSEYTAQPTLAYNGTIHMVLLGFNAMF